MSGDEATFLHMASFIALYPDVLYPVNMTSLLFLMYSSGCIEAVRLLVQNFGADPHAFDPLSRRTPLMYACRKKRMGMVKFHVEHFRSNLDKIHVDRHGYSASMHGLESTEITQFLIAEGLFEPSLETVWSNHDHFQLAVVRSLFDSARIVMRHLYSDSAVQSVKINRLFSDVIFLNGQHKMKFKRSLQEDLSKIVLQQLNFIESISGCKKRTGRIAQVAFERSMDMVRMRHGVLIRYEPFLWMVEMGFAIDACEIGHCGKSKLHRDYLRGYLDPCLFLKALEKKRAINDAVICFEHIFEAFTKRSKTIIQELIRVFSGAGKTTEQQDNVTTFFIYLKKLQRVCRR